MKRVEIGDWPQPRMSESSPVSKPRPLVFSVAVEEGGKRLDKVVRDRVPDLSRTQGQRLIEVGQVTVCGRSRKPSYRVEPGEEVTVLLPVEDPHPSLSPEHIPLDIVYEDEQLLVVNKPAGLVVHPGPGHPDGTLVNALLFHYPTIEDVGPPGRLGIVHRLDKETSGVLVVAKNQETLESLQDLFRNREVEKTYLALVNGQVEPDEGIIEVPIGRDPTDRQKMAALSGGKYSRTRFRVVRWYRRHTLLDAHPYTGRTHQVRVHLSWLGYPVVGDTVYGRRRQPLLEERHFLHASDLTLTHPVTNQKMTFAAPIPQELQDVLDRLRPATSEKQTGRVATDNPR